MHGVALVALTPAWCGGGGCGALRYKSPDFLTYVSFSGKVESDNPDDIMAVAVEVLRAADEVLAAHQGWNGDVDVPSMRDGHFGIGLSTYEGVSTSRRTHRAHTRSYRAHPLT